jgi:hypothetical protein
VLVASVVPFPTTTVPEWKLRYVDKRGNPVPGLLVSQTWQNYSIESRANYTDGSTDLQGYVTFPEHKSWSPLLVRLVHPVLNILSTGVHASFGSSSWVIPKCDVKESGPAQAVYYGQPLPTEIVVVYEDRSRLRAAMPGSMQPAASCKAVEAQVKDAA